jgi:flagellar biosynthesis/type III secretory pathway protein FliH
MAAVEVQARETAERLLARAHAEAEAIVARAQEDARTVAARAAEEARQAEVAKLSALALRLKAAEDAQAERDLDRTMDVAVILAERLLGASLDHDPATIGRLARQALHEARGVRRALIHASPGDTEALGRCLDEGGVGGCAVEVRADPAVPRGSLRVSTNLGTLDVQLRPQLEQLAAALRDSLRR